MNGVDGFLLGGRLCSDTFDCSPRWPSGRACSWADAAVLARRARAQHLFDDALNDDLAHNLLFDGDIDGDLSEVCM